MATIKQIKRDLGDLGVEYPKNAKKRFLEDLLEHSNRRFDDEAEAMVASVQPVEPDDIPESDDTPDGPACVKCGARIGSLRCGECGHARINEDEFIDPNWGTR